MTYIDHYAVEIEQLTEDQLSKIMEADQSKNHRISKVNEFSNQA